MSDPLAEYRRKRDASRTPEPVPPDTGAAGPGDRFVVQQHHARSLHWDLRLERDGVLASWAVPRGLPRDPGRSHLAVRTEDHPLEYLDFSGVIPAGEYGGGRMTVHDRGRYHCEKWRDDEVLVTLRGARVSGRYALVRTGGRDGRDWLLRRTGPAPPGWTPMPETVEVMLPTPASRLPTDGSRYGYEMRWSGTRAVAYVSGGRLRLLAADGTDVTGAHRPLRELAEALAPTEAVLDGVLATLGGTAQYLLFDLLWLEGASSLGLPYAQRRELLDGLALAGVAWQTPPYFPADGRAALRTVREQGLGGVVAKRLDAPYRPGHRSRDWLAIGV